MLKRQIIKKVFDEQFNIENMHKQILLKNERKDKKTMIKNYKIALPICLLAVICSIFFFTQKDIAFKTSKNDINIQKLEDIYRIEQVFEVDEVDIEKIPEKFEFMYNVNVPNTFRLERKYNLYTRSNIEVDRFDILRDYVFEYKNSSENEIIISFSELGYPLKDYHLTEEISSKINNIDVYISQYQKEYIVSFQYRDIYFCIETEDISIKELTSLLESIIK